MEEQIKPGDVVRGDFVQFDHRTYEVLHKETTSVDGELGYAIYLVIPDTCEQTFRIVHWNTDVTRFR